VNRNSRKKKPKKSLDPNEDREMDSMMNGLGEVVQKKDRAQNMVNGKVVNSEIIANQNGNNLKNNGSDVYKNQNAEAMAYDHKLEGNITGKRLIEDEKQREYEEGMKNYLDQEMTNILDKIKGIKKSEPEPEEDVQEEQNQELDDDNEGEVEDEEEYEIDEEGNRKRKTKVRTTVTRTVTSSITVKKKEKEDEPEVIEKDEEEEVDNKDSQNGSGFKGLGSDQSKKRLRTKTTVTRTKEINKRKSYGGRLIGTNPDRESSPTKDQEFIESRGDSMGKLKGDHLLSKVTHGQEGSETKDESIDDIKEESVKDDKRKTISILRKNTSRKTRKSVRFHKEDLEQEEADINEEFIRKVPTGTITLTNEQRDMLIDVLEEPDNEEDDLILSLDPNQVKDVVIENFAGENATIALDLDNKRNVLNSGANRVSIYPKNFFAMVEKQKLKGSRVSVYPGKFFDDVEKGVARRDKGRKDARVSIYPKDLFELVDHEIDAGRISVYPQEMFDLFNECEDKDTSPSIRKKAQSIYPGEFFDLVDKQKDRAQRGRKKSVYPKELFDLAEQEKVNGERVSVYPRELFKLLSKEAQKQRGSIYPKDLFEILDTEYSNVVKLTPEQSELLIKKNLNDENTHIVLSENQRKDLLGKLKDHKKKEEKYGSEKVKDLEVNLEKDQVMDILNQNCMDDGVEIDLESKQIKDLKEVRTIRPTVIGNEYYDVMVDQLVNEEGDRLELNRLSGTKRRSLLDQLGKKKMSVIDVANGENPEVLSETHYDPKKDEIVSRKSRKSVMKLGDDQGTRKSRLSTFTRKSVNTRRRTSMMGMAYYDAMCNELVDDVGQRFSLEDKSPKEIKSIMTDLGVTKVPVVVEQENEDDAVVLNQVDYMPGKDCLVDEKGRKTILNDLSDNERKSLMKILGEKRGSKVSSHKGSEYGSKKPKPQKKLRFGSGNKPMTMSDRERELEKRKIRRATGYPTDMINMKKNQTDKLKNEILHGKPTGNRGSMVDSRNGLGDVGRKRVNTIHPKGGVYPDRKVKTSADEGMILEWDESDGDKGKRKGKNIQNKRMTTYGSPKRNFTDKRKTLGSPSRDKLSREQLKKMGEDERQKRLDEKKKEEWLRKELAKKKQEELEKAKKKREYEERLAMEKKRIEDLRIANERKRMQQLKIAQEKRRIEEERLLKHKKKNEELRRASELRKQKKREEEEEKERLRKQKKREEEEEKERLRKQKKREEEEEEKERLRKQKKREEEEEKERLRKEKLRQRKTIKNLTDGKSKNVEKRRTLGGNSPKSGSRPKTKTMMVKDRQWSPETDDYYMDTDPQESIKRPSRKSNVTNSKTRKKGKTISNIHDRYYAGGDKISKGKHIISEGLDLKGGKESPSPSPKKKKSIKEDPSRQSVKSKKESYTSKKSLKSNKSKKSSKSSKQSKNVRSK
jgi:hypothetical protein